MTYLKDILFTLFCAVLLTGCGGGGSSPPLVQNDPFSISMDLPPDLIHGQTAEWQVEISGGKAPYTVQWELGGGGIGDAGNPEFLMTGSSDQTLEYEYRVTVTDGDGTTSSLSGTYEILPRAGAPRKLSVAVPDDMVSSDISRWLASWECTNLPCTMQWLMGGGGVDVPAGTIPSSTCTDDRWIEMTNAGSVTQSYSGVVRVTDSLGCYVEKDVNYLVAPNTNPQGPATGGEDPPQRDEPQSSDPGAEDPPQQNDPPSQDPGNEDPGNEDPPIVNAPPQLVSADFDQDRWDLAITVEDPEDGLAGLAVELSEPEELMLSNTSLLSDAAGMAIFHLIPQDPFADTDTPIEVSVTDSEGEVSSNIISIQIPRIVLAPDSLYAIPLDREIAIDEPVRVLIATGMPASQLAYLNSVAVLSDMHGTYIPGSFNVGALGSSSKDADGVWSTCQSLGFLTTSEGMLTGQPAGGGQVFWDFTLASIQPDSPISCAGALFSFELSYSQPGTYKLGFVEELGVKYTYFSNLLAEPCDWADISNNYPGCWNSVMVE